LVHSSIESFRVWSIYERFTFESDWF
jgi:hypothetical protein